MAALSGRLLTAGLCALLAWPLGAEPLVVLEPGRLDADGWQPLKLVGETEWQVAEKAGELAVRARGRQSASGLSRELHLDARECAVLEWRWRVDAVQESADLRRRDADDVGASLYLLFGDPGWSWLPREVHTLRYVWAGPRNAVGDVIASPYLPESVRSIVVRSASADLGRWYVERRDLVADYMAAFGSPPVEPVHAIVLFTDNDQTAEPVEAWYAWVRAECGRRE